MFIEGPLHEFFFIALAVIRQEYGQTSGRVRIRMEIGQ